MEQGLPFEPKKMGVGGIIDNSLRIYRNNFPAIFLISLVFYGGVALLTSLITLTQGGMITANYGELIQRVIEGASGGYMDTADILDIYFGMLGGMATSMGIGLLASLFVTPYFEGSIARVSIGYYHGERRTVGEWFSAMRKSYWKLFTLNLCSMVAVAVTVLAGIVASGIVILPVSFAFAAGGFGIAIGIVLILALITFGVVFFMAAFTGIMMAYPVAVTENKWNFQAIGRGLGICFRKMWKVSGNMLVVSLLFGIIAYIMAAIVMVFGFLSIAAATIASSLVYSLVSPVIYIATSMLYLDLRISGEGYDLALRSMISGGTGAGARYQVPPAGSSWDGASYGSAAHYEPPRHVPPVQDATPAQDAPAVQDATPAQDAPPADAPDTRNTSEQPSWRNSASPWKAGSEFSDGKPEDAEDASGGQEKGE